MRLLELVALAIVVGFVLVRTRFGPEPRTFLRRMALLVVASWIAEDTCIRAYGFYFYAPGWSLFVDHVPIAILLIWPIVIHSAWELARCLLGRGHRWIPLAAALLVWADASMIEPIAVRAGLWRWTEPGLFEVPPIGILGWAFYAGLCMWLLEVSERRGADRTGGARGWELSVLVLAPAGTHLLLLGSWWGFFRWVNRDLSPWPFVAVVWLVSLALTVWSLRRQAQLRVPARDMLSRVPAALYFFVLLVVYGRDQSALVAWALAFAPPYLSLTVPALSGLARPRMLG